MKNNHPEVIVLSGGNSPERQVSLWSGQAVAEALSRRGIRTGLLDPSAPGFFEKICESRDKVEAVFIALHGQGGEDGTIQGFLETLGLPYTGSGVLASGLASDKLAAKQCFRQHGIPTPAEAGKSDLPLVVKPVTGGSTLGISIVRKDEDLSSAVDNARNFGDGRFFFEKFVPGTEITIGILGSGEEARALPAIEIVPCKGFYDFEAKYHPGGSRHIMPPGLPARIVEKASEITLEAHRAIGCRAFSRSELIVNEKKEIFLLELNTIPGFTPTSLYPEAARAEGIDLGALAALIIDLSLGRKRFT